MDDTLSKFVDQTGCDPSFARDLLEGKKWDLDDALKAFKELSLGSTTRTTKTSVATKPQRGISVVNSDIVHKARTQVLERDVPGEGSQSESFKDVAKYTFVLPDLSSFTQDFGEFLRKDLTETSAVVALEQSGHLNWWADMGICQRIVPLATVGDGNCLLHAASLGMWGFHDRLLTLRKALFRTLADHPASGAINRRWKLQQYQKNMEAGGLVYTDDEWKKEWEEVLRLASTNRRKIVSSSSKSSLDQPISTTQSHEPKEMDAESEKLNESDTLSGQNPNPSANKENEKCTDDVKASGSEVEVKEKASESQENFESDDNEGAYESLEDIHVFVLAHVLRRPIIIIADKYLRDFSGDPIAPIPFGGIYLPLECPHQTCHKTPLILVFESAHFSAAVVSEEKNKQTKSIGGIPVVDQDLSMLPLHFSVDPGEKFDWTALNDETQLPAKLTLSADKKLDYLEKYLNIAHIRIPNSAKKDALLAKKDTSQAEKGSGETDKKGKKEGSQNGEGRESSWLNNPITSKVGEFADKIKKFVDTSTVCIAKIQTNEKPDYYDEMINNYIQSAKKRFEEKKQIQEQQNLQGTSKQFASQPCITPGCSLYGTAESSYLCSACYKAQKSASQSGMYKNSSSTSSTPETSSSFKSYLPPGSLSSCVPFDYFTGAKPAASSTTPATPPPSYSEACQRSMEIKSERVCKCHGDGCEFFGSPERKGYCSSCYKKQTANL